MIDVEIIWKHVFLEPREEILRIGRKLRRCAGEAGQHFRRTPFRADRIVAHPGEVRDEQIDYAIAELLHLFRGKFEARVVHVRIVGRFCETPMNCAVVAALSRRAKRATTNAATERRCYSATDSDQSTRPCQ